MIVIKLALYVVLDSLLKLVECRGCVSADNFKVKWKNVSV